MARSIPPERPLPLDESFGDADSYVHSLLEFVSSNELFQLICGGIHILDFLTQEPDLYASVIPLDWRTWFHDHEIASILDLLLREDTAVLHELKRRREAKADESGDQCHGLQWRDLRAPPTSLLDYIIEVRRHSLRRDFKRDGLGHMKSSNVIPRHVAVGMKPKKVHEVGHLAQYIDEVNAYISDSCNQNITHLLDIGSGQNYLGRTLASSPYDKHVIALESKPENINGARAMDVHAKLAKRAKVVRNKKQYRLTSTLESSVGRIKAHQASTASKGPTIHNQGEGHRLSYIEKRLETGDLSSVFETLRVRGEPDLGLMTISLHSCGNLTHLGLHSLAANERVKAAAMVGCCYNLVTSRLGPPTFKLASLRSSNLRLDQTSSACDPQGFPISETMAHYRNRTGAGIHLNITARMMACQAPNNWTTQDCKGFFTRHFYRALLQRILVDRGLAQKPRITNDIHVEGMGSRSEDEREHIIIGSLRKSCYSSFTAYVRGAAHKMQTDLGQGGEIASSLARLTDYEIQTYEAQYDDKRKQLAVTWSLMAFSATVVESVMVVDRWLFLKEQPDVKKFWVEPVFEYSQSPRNLVVVGIKGH